MDAFIPPTPADQLHGPLRAPTAAPRDEEGEGSWENGPQSSPLPNAQTVLLVQSLDICREPGNTEMNKIPSRLSKSVRPSSLAQKFRCLT